MEQSLIWLKLGGDKRGSTFKIAFQHLNVESPNAPDNICIFALFEAPHHSLAKEMAHRIWDDRRVGSAQVF